MNADLAGSDRGAGGRGFDWDQGGLVGVDRGDWWEIGNPSLTFPPSRQVPQTPRRAQASRTPTAGTWTRSRSRSR